MKVKKFSTILENREKFAMLVCNITLYFCGIVSICTYIAAKNSVNIIAISAVLVAHIILTLIFRSKSIFVRASEVLFAIVVCILVSSGLAHSLYDNLLLLAGACALSVIFFNKKIIKCLVIVDSIVCLVAILAFKKVFLDSDIGYAIALKHYFYFLVVVMLCYCATYYGENMLETTQNRLKESTEMADKINTQMNEVTKLQTTQSEVTGQIKDVSDNVENMANNIHSAVDNLSASTSNQASAVEEVTAAICEVENAAENNLTVATKLNDIADTTIKNADVSSSQMNEMIKSIKEIKEASTKIREITRNIKSISTQTNMLSLNASIEAVSAGKNGKGFSVVASEIKTLAEKSAESAKTTDEFIDSILDLIDRSDKIVSMTATSLSKIFNDINNLGDSVKSMSQSSISQKTSLEQINQTMQSISGEVQNNAATAQETAATSQLMLTESKKLNQIATKLN